MAKEQILGVVFLILNPLFRLIVAGPKTNGKVNLYYLLGVLLNITILLSTHSTQYGTSCVHNTSHNTQHTTEITITIVPPSCWLPVAPILQVSAIAVHQAIDHNHCNTVMYFFLWTLTFPLFILLLFYVQQLSALAD
jgi:hypothetical protein